MKKILISIALVSMLSAAAAAYSDVITIGQSSFTTTNDTTRVIPRSLPGTFLIGIVVSSGMPQGAGIALYDSSGTATNQIGFVSGYSVSQQPNYIPYGIFVSSGLTYTTTNNSGGFSIIYKTFRP